MREKRLLSDFIIDDIKAMLKNGKLKEGDRLPNQNDFAKQLGVSRISLREALRALETMGVVKQRPKTGTVILNGNPDNWGNNAGIELKDEDDMRQMLLARKCVEATVAVEAAKYITSKQIAKLTRVYYEMDDANKNKDLEGYLAKDKEFHMLIAEACGNKYLRGMYELSLRQGDGYMKQIFMAQPAAFEKTVSSHKEIFEAIAERCPDSIKRAIRKHTAQLDNLAARFYRDGGSQAGTLYYP